jgi:F-type H+-transporting ATPase subunit a
LNGIIDVFVGLLELISEFARLISFTFRLFGNIFAGEVLLFMMSFLMPFVLVDVFYALEIFVGLIQAFVFAMLTLVFGVMAVSGHGEHEAHAGHGAHAEAGAHGGAHA